MALINCPECSASISDKAPTCPKCGVPLSAENIATETTLVTTQETSKTLKIHTLISTCLVILGLIITMSAEAGGGSQTLGVLMAVAGFVWFIVTRFRTWWHHK